MAVVRTIINVIVFIAAGLAAIVVGAFMLRGTMKMWDRRDKQE